MDKAQIVESLKQVVDPEIGLNIVELNMVKDVKVEGDRVDLLIALTVKGCPLAHTIKDDVQRAVSSLEGVRTVNVETTAMTPQELERLRVMLRGRMKTPARSPTGIQRLEKRGINHIIAIVSGKGGVGKSFVTSMMAAEMRKQGYEVGVLDADITGPSIAKMFGLNQRPMPGLRGVLPVPSGTGVKVMSINLILDDPARATIWRGPIINSVIRQLYTDVEWSDLHYLFVDLPPGTSDAPLTVFQSLPLDGVLVVSTPQDLAHMIVAKAMNMAQAMSVPVLGLIENMGYIECPNCGEVIEHFGPSKAEVVAKKFGIPLLGVVPLDPKISLHCDDGSIEEYSHPILGEVARNLRLLVTKKMVEKPELTPITWKTSAAHGGSNNPAEPAEDN